MSLSDLNRIDKVLDDMIAIRDGIDNDIKASDNRIAIVEKKLEDIISDIASPSTQSRGDTFKSDVQEIKTDLRKLEKKLQDYIDNNSDDLESSEAKAGRDETLENKITDLEKRLKDFANEDKRSKIAIHNLKILGKHFREQSSTKDNELLENIEVVDTLKSELEKTQMALKEANSRTSELIIEKEKLNKAMQDIIKTNLEKEKMKGVLESQLSTFRTENNALKTRLNDIQDEKDKLKQKLKLLKVKRRLGVKLDKYEEIEGETKKRKFDSFMM